MDVMFKMKMMKTEVLLHDDFQTKILKSTRQRNAFICEWKWENFNFIFNPISYFIIKGTFFLRFISSFKVTHYSFRQHHKICIFFNENFSVFIMFFVLGQKVDQCSFTQEKKCDTEEMDIVGKSAKMAKQREKITWSWRFKERR